MPKGGFGDLERQLKQLERNIKKQTEEEVSVNVLLNDSFMSDYTEFPTFDAFLGALPDGSFEDMLENQREMVDEFVRNNSRFDSWDSMIGKAGEKYMAKKLKKLF
jgi:hypothetical protein